MTGGIAHTAAPSAMASRRSPRRHAPTGAARAGSRNGERNSSPPQLETSSPASASGRGGPNPPSGAAAIRAHEEAWCRYGSVHGVPKQAAS